MIVASSVAMRSIAAAVVLVSVLAGSARADDGDRWDGSTASAILEGETAGMFVGGAVGLVGGLAVLYARDRRDKGEIVYPLVGIAIGCVAGIPLGAQLGGDAAGGTGRWYGTALGELAGLGATAGFLYLATRLDGEGPIKAAVAASILALFAGPFLGYELTSDADPSSTARVSPLWSAAF